MSGAPMDPLVLAAMAKWPNVPDVYGWLALSARGQWRLRGEPIGNAALREFIGRNYARDARGAWYFQNGPQRVFVDLELAPWVLHADGVSRWFTHTAAPVGALRAAALLDDGRVVLDTEQGAGLVDGQDLGRVAAALDGDALDPRRLGLAGGPCALEPMDAAALPARFGFVRVPRA